MITQSEVRKLFSYNKKTGILRWKIRPAKNVRPNTVAGTINPDGYIQISIKGKQYLAHRLIWLGMKGYLPENMIDHKDRIKYHNWWDNLREATSQCNQRNTDNRKNNMSGVKGVYFDKGKNKYRVQIMVNRVNKYLGLHIDFDEAVCHRLAAEQCLYWSNCDSNSPAYNYINKKFTFY